MEVLADAVRGCARRRLFSARPTTMERMVVSRRLVRMDGGGETAGG